MRRLTLIMLIITVALFIANLAEGQEPITRWLLTGHR